MAKPIYVPQDEAARIIEALRLELKTKCYGNISFKQSIKSDDRRALLYFSPTAWIKMTALVSEFTTEVQWHGLVRRMSECEFEIYDIVVPPHTVTSATVTSDQEKYSNWINDLDDDTFNALRFHGHSHVNMAVSPSSVDTDYRKDVVTQLPKSDANNDTFYIFLIMNKRHEWSAEIYDLTYNALYSTNAKEIDMVILIDDENNVNSFIAEAKKVAVQSVITTKNYNHSPYSGSQNQTPVSSGTGYSKKNETKNTSARGEGGRFGVDEDPSDPFYSSDRYGGWY